MNIFLPAVMAVVLVIQAAVGVLRAVVVVWCGAGGHAGGGGVNLAG